MEDILDLYAEPYDPDYPVICVDERPCQLLGEVIEPLPAKKGTPRRYDYEYERQGTCNVFESFEPLAGFREIQVRERRTKSDFAHFIRDLVDKHYVSAKKIRLVCDNLATHTYSAFYETFGAEEGHRLKNKMEFYYTPKHASWLNMVEIEFSILSRQCLCRRIPNIQTLASEANAWKERRNAQQAKVNWRFKTTDARHKMKRAYIAQSN
jgi:hypothetical protein